MKKRVNKILVFLIMFLAIGGTVFFSSELCKYYNSTVKKNNGSEELIYVFNETTKLYADNYRYDANEDISEQFLSYHKSYGIDVSVWQGSIDWERVANSGISFAMIRCGYRETVGGKIHEDPLFRKNIEGAQKVGLKVGVYFFGVAKNEKEALEEAEFTVNLIKDYRITYPVVYDMETFNFGRLKEVDSSTLTNNILTFTETVASYGYETMVYTYKYAFSNILDTGKLDGKLIWLAHFIDKTDYRGNYNMWQYTSEGRVSGIQGNVDLNVSYFEYVNDENDIVANPDYKKCEDVEFEKTEDKVKTISSSTIRNTPTTKMPNSLGKIKYGEVLERTGVSDSFSRVIYNGRTVYIENKYISVIK